MSHSKYSVKARPQPAGPAPRPRLDPRPAKSRRARRPGCRGSTTLSHLRAEAVSSAAAGSASSNPASPRGSKVPNPSNRRYASMPADTTDQGRGGRRPIRRRAAGPAASPLSRTTKPRRGNSATRISSRRAGAAGTPRPPWPGGADALPVSVRLPMLDLAGARALLGLHKDRIREQIELGELTAWDISRGGGSRRQYRILGASARLWPKAHAMPEPELILRVYGPAPEGHLHRVRWLGGCDFSRAWNCDSDHTLNLIRDGVLALVPNTSYGRGQGRTPRITWASAIEFLRARRL